MSKTIFEEKQIFYKNPFMLVAIGVTLIVLISQQLSSGNNFLLDINNYTSTILILVMAWLLFIQLKTRIDEKGIHVTFFPFIWKRKTFTWEDIYSAKAIKYSPLGDYGGWGYRISFKGKGRAYNIHGNKGINIVLKDGKIRLIGTQKMDEANSCIAQYLPKKA